MKNTRRILSLALALMLLALSTAFAEEITTDRGGNPITLPEKAEKIMSFAPSTTQIIMDMGLTDKLVAVDTYSAQYWEEVAGLPQFDMMSPDNEAIAVLEPDVIFVTGMSYQDGENPFQTLVDLGICVCMIPSSYTIEDIRLDIDFIATILGVPEKGAELIAGMDKVIDEVAAIGATVTDKKTVLFEISALPYIYAPGDNTFIDEMIELIGAVNCLDGQDSWVSVTEEAALEMNPDVILTSSDYIDDPVAEVLGREGWENVSAIANGEVYYISSRTSGLPNHHIADALWDMAKAVYPELFAADEAA